MQRAAAGDDAFAGTQCGGCSLLQPPWTFMGEVLRRQISRSIIQHSLTILIDHFGVSYRGWQKESAIDPGVTTDIRFNESPRGGSSLPGGLRLKKAG